MKKEHTLHYTELQGEDDNGKWVIRVHNDCSQINIETNDGLTSTFIDTNAGEISILRDVLTAKVNGVKPYKSVPFTPSRPWTPLEKTDSNEPYWVIENSLSSTGQPAYWTGKPPHPSNNLWTPNIEKAWTTESEKIALNFNKQYKLKGRVREHMDI